ncbi:MAG: YtxH domain-containing protein [Bacteroidota bacterium]
MSKNNNTAKVIGALAVGLLAGSALGMLFAPDKGAMTRRNISDGLKGMAQRIKDPFNSAKIQLAIEQKLQKQWEKNHDIVSGNQTEHNY